MQQVGHVLSLVDALQVREGGGVARLDQRVDGRGEQLEEPAHSTVCSPKRSTAISSRPWCAADRARASPARRRRRRRARPRVPVSRPPAPRGSRAHRARCRTPRASTRPGAVGETRRTSTPGGHSQPRVERGRSRGRRRARHRGGGPRRRTRDRGRETACRERAPPPPRRARRPRRARPPRGRAGALPAGARPRPHDHRPAGGAQAVRLRRPLIPKPRTAVTGVSPIAARRAERPSAWAPGLPPACRAAWRPSRPEPSCRASSWARSPWRGRRRHPGRADVAHRAALAQQHAALGPYPHPALDVVGAYGLSAHLVGRAQGLEQLGRVRGGAPLGRRLGGEVGRIGLLVPIAQQAGQQRVSVGGLLQFFSPR